MNTLGLQILSIILSVAACVFYIPLILTAINRREGQESAAMLFVIFTGIALVLQVIVALWHSGIVNGSGEGFRQIELYGMLALAILLVLIVRVFLRLDGGKAWYAVGILWVIMLVLLTSNALKLPNVVWENENYYITRKDAAEALLVVGWAIFVSGAVLALFLVYRRTKQALYRNRFAFWVPVFILLVANDGLVILGEQNWMGLLRLAGTGLMAYVILTHHVQDIREIARRTLIYLITTLLIVLVYAAGIAVTNFVFAEAGGYNPMVIVGVIAVILAALFTPLLGLVRRFVNHLFTKEDYDASRTLRDYSLSVSNIIDMEKLASVAVGLIMDTLSISRGFLFLVDKENQSDGQMAYRLRGVEAEQDFTASNGLLNDSSPVAVYLTKEQHPLLQYDIDLLPGFLKMPANEREWLRELDTEVYVPIYSKREWIGMFAFGAKLSGRRYTEEDLVVLFTLAQQTAVALENARLVDDLVKLNQQLRQAYIDLDQANHNLEKIDRTKSDFINIASHELRTPLTIIRGYAGILLDTPAIQKEEYLDQMVKGINDGTQRMTEIMESMFDIAQIDNRTMQLHMQDVLVHDLARNVAINFKNIAKEREQTLIIEIPSLPSIKADPNLLEKIFQHLIRNAIKFTPNGGKITISGGMVSAYGRDFPAGGVEIVVSDTGIGIDPASREVIFTKFYQAGDINKHSTGKTKFKGAGTGLGLALSKGIVEAHGGRIWVESTGYDEQKCPGSQFHVALPIWRAANKEPITLPLPKNDNKGEK
jgi:signal transduction histidine kinase